MNWVNDTFVPRSQFDVDIGEGRTNHLYAGDVIDVHDGGGGTSLCQTVALHQVHS